MLVNTKIILCWANYESTHYPLLLRYGKFMERWNYKVQFNWQLVRVPGKEKERAVVLMIFWFLYGLNFIFIPKDKGAMYTLRDIVYTLVVCIVSCAFMIGAFTMWPFPRLTWELLSCCYLLLVALVLTQSFKVNSLKWSVDFCVQLWNHILFTLWSFDLHWLPRAAQTEHTLSCFK